jgi:hypothetical protein
MSDSSLFEKAPGANHDGDLFDKAPEAQTEERNRPSRTEASPERFKDTTRSRSQDAALDPFDPARLALPQDFMAAVGVKKALLTIPVRKPAKEWFVRVHPDVDYRVQTAVLELKEDRETYLVAPELQADLATEPTFSLRALFTAMTRQNVLFIWPVRLPDANGRIDEWSRSSLEGAQMAQSRWVRIASNMSLGAYEVSYATAEIPEPQWPDFSFRELLRIAFKDRLIDSLAHPVLKKLRGET